MSEENKCSTPVEELKKDKTLAECSLSELKSHAYDQIAALESAQKKLEILNREISLRSSQA